MNRATASLHHTSSCRVAEVSTGTISPTLHHDAESGHNQVVDGVSKKESCSLKSIKRRTLKLSSNTSVHDRIYVNVIPRCSAVSVTAQVA
jgi:hypothetical protein